MAKVIILGHENPDVDSVVSGYLLEKILTKKGYDVEFIIPEKKIDSDTLNICMRNGLNLLNFRKKLDLKDESLKYILVDHNKRDLKGEIVAIIDHHPINSEIKIDHYYHQKISSTACYICRGNEELLDEFDLRLAVLATMVDTVSFHSTKGREEDKKWVLDLCNRCHFDYEELYKEGLCLSPLDDIKKVCLNGLKRYRFDDKKVESSYIQVENPSAVKDKIYQIIDILKEYVETGHLDAFVFIVCDMKKFVTMYYLITESEIQSKYYDVYASRGDIIMPEVEKVIKNKCLIKSNK